jgi:hypothetical protein
METIDDCIGLVSMAIHALGYIILYGIGCYRINFVFFLRRLKSDPKGKIVSRTQIRLRMLAWLLKDGGSK